MNRLELLEAILFSDDYEIQDTKVLLVYILERMDVLEQYLDCIDEKLDVIIKQL